VWILIANAWMQNPVGAEFNHETMRMELTSFTELLFNPVAGVKFVHTVAAGYVTASMFVLGISSYYLLRLRELPFAVRSFAVAAGFGLASALSVIVLGDASEYTAGETRKVKLAAIEAEWETVPPPASFTAFGFPDQASETTRYAIKIPWLLGLIATRSVDTPVKGIKDLKIDHEARIRGGMKAYAALQKLRAGDRSAETKAEFERTRADLGYGLLLRKYTDKVVDATPEQIKQAGMKELQLILKGDVGGSVEVLADSLQRLSTDKVRVKILRTGVGAITESDVLLATASNAVIIGFNVRPERKAQEIAEQEGVDIRLHSIIYELQDEIKLAMAGLLDPVIKENYQGRAAVRQTFKVPKLGTIAGCSAGRSPRRPFGPRR